MAKSRNENGTLPTMLAVEDDSNDVLLLRRVVEKAALRCRLQVLRDGDQAIAYLAGAGEYADRVTYPIPRLVMLDLKLPRRSGFEVLSWLRDQPGLRFLPVVVFSSSRQRADVERAYELRANSYIVKPVHYVDFLQIVKSVGEYWFLINEQPEVGA